MDISKYFRKSLGLRDNEGRLILLVSFETNEPILHGYFENRIPLKSLLGCFYSLANYIASYEELNKTEFSIFVLLCVPCFPRQTFRFCFIPVSIPVY